MSTLYHVNIKDMTSGNNIPQSGVTHSTLWNVIAILGESNKRSLILRLWHITQTPYPDQNVPYLIHRLGAVAVPPRSSLFSSSRTSPAKDLDQEL